MWGKDKEKETQPQPMTVASPTGVRPVAPPIETTIGPNTHITGDIKGDGGIRVDGVVEGNIETTGNLVITESAKVLAELKANNVSISGAVRGNISANRVEILDTGRVWGDLTIKSLLINEGAYLRGQTIMPQDLKPPQVDNTPLPKNKVEEPPHPPLAANSVSPAKPAEPEVTEEKKA